MKPYDKLPKSNSFLSFCPGLFFNWAGHLAVAGKVERTARARSADLHGNAIRNAPDLDS